MREVYVACGFEALWNRWCVGKNWGLLAARDDAWEGFWLHATHRRDRLDKIYL